MKWTHAKVVFESRDPTLARDLIADLFYDFGLQGVVVEDPAAEPDLDWADDALPSADQHAVNGYFAHTQDLDARLHGLETDLAGLASRIDLRYDLVCAPVDEEDWAQSWKAHFHPLKVGARVVIKPSWEAYRPAAGEIVLEIDPGMAFGTGTHATTALCIRMLETHLRPGDTLLDVGTGSGILMLAAARLGAGRMLGIDSDPVAIEVAGANLGRNAIAPECFELRRGHLLTGLKGRFDLVVANILTAVILELADALPSVLAPGGGFICSGIIAAKRSQVVKKLEGLNLEVLDCQEEEGWVAICARHKPQGQS